MCLLNDCNLSFFEWPSVVIYILVWLFQIRMLEPVSCEVLCEKVFNAKQSTMVVE